MRSPTPATPRTRSRRSRRDRGAVIPLVALFMSVLMVGTAFSVDLGRLRTARRDLQADADFLALDAASVLDGLTVDEALPYVIDEGNASATRNQYAFEPITAQHVELGWWEDNVFVPMSGSEVPNAVRVTLTDMVEMYFDMSADERSVTRTAIGVDDYAPDGSEIPESPTTTTTTGPSDPTTTTSIPEPKEITEAASRAELGSVLASLDLYQQPTVDAAFNAAVEAQLTFMNHIYTEFLNISTSVNFDAGVTGEVDPPPVTGPATGLRLDAVSWQGLAAGQVDIDDVAEELRLQGVLATGTTDEMLSTTVGAGQFLSAAATVLSNSPRVADVEASSILLGIATAVDNTLTINLGRYLQATTGRRGTLETIIHADDLLLATVSLINGRNLVAAEIPVTLPGVNQTITPKISVVEPPQTHEGYRKTGEPGPSTAQIKIAVEIPVQDLKIDLNVLSTLTGVVTRNGTVPLVIEVAKANSLYTDMACRTDTERSFTDLLIESGALAISFGTVPEASLTSTGSAGPLTAKSFVDGSVSILGVNVNLSSYTNVKVAKTWHEGVSRNGNVSVNSSHLGSTETMRHLAPYETPWVRYPGIGSDIIQHTFAGLPFNGITSSLIPNLDAELTKAIKDAYAPLMSQIDEVLLDPLLKAMGVELAGADARMLGLMCKSVYLA